MALLNQSCIVHYDNNGNVSRYMIADNCLYRTRWNRKNGMDKNERMAKNTEEIKACCDKEGNLYVFCLTVDENIDVYKVFSGGVSQIAFIPEKNGCYLRDFRPYFIGERLELLISYSNSENKEERILKKYSLDVNGIINNQKYIDFMEKSIMIYKTVGPVDVMASVRLCEDESEIISIIEKDGKSDSIILLRDNRSGYVEGLIKISMEYEILWHDIYSENQKLIIAFTVRDGNEFSIKYTEYDIKNRIVLPDITIRERKNCSHPVIVNYDENLWICWNENGSVYSTIIKESDKCGEIVKWKDSSGKKFFCSDFIIDNEEIELKYGLKCRKAFITYPQNYITGVGKYHTSAK